MKPVTFHTHQSGTMPALAVKYGERTVIFAPEKLCKQSQRTKPETA